MIINVDNTLSSNDWWDQSTDTYNTIQNEIKNNWKMYKYGKSAFISFSEWENRELEQLKKENPEQFREYCAGLIKTADTQTLNYNTTKDISVLAVLGVTAGGVLAGALTPSLALGAMAIAVACAVNMAVKIAGRRQGARHVLSRLWTSPNFRIRKVVFNLNKKDKENNRIYLKEYPREAILKDIVYCKLLKRAAFPKVVKEHLMSADFETKIAKTSTQDVQFSRLARLRKWWWTNSHGCRSEKLRIGGTGFVSSIGPSQAMPSVEVSTQKEVASDRALLAQ